MNDKYLLQIKGLSKSFSGVNFKICAKCKCVYQDPTIKTNYSDSYCTLFALSLSNIYEQ